MLVIKGGRLKRYSDEPHNSLKDGNVGVALCLFFFLPLSDHFPEISQSKWAPGGWWFKSGTSEIVLGFSLILM